MIRHFRDRTIERLWMGETVRRFVSIQKATLYKLDMLNSAVRLADLAAVPGNKLKALQRDRKGQHSIRINYQWRVCFRWRPDGPHEVEIVDYH